jgi:hypothetical protein
MGAPTERPGDPEADLDNARGRPLLEGRYVSTYSIVALAIRQPAYCKLSPESADFLGSNATNQRESVQEDLFFLFENIKWSIEHPEIQRLYEELKRIPAVDYLLLEGCYDHPESKEMDRGEWTNNPWGLQKILRAHLDFEI